MPPIADNAPTAGVPALVYWALIGFAVLLFVARYFFASGKDRLSARETERADAISVLQSQVAALQAEVASLREEVHRMTENERYNRDYRHALANQVQGLLLLAEDTLELLRLVCSAWAEIPAHLKVAVARVKEPRDVLSRNPLPPSAQGSS